MKVGILTRRAGYNMGSSLQAYAMAKMITKLGYDVEIINYDEYAHFLMWRIKPVISRVVHVALYVWPLNRIFGNCHQQFNRIFEQRKRFEQFEKKYFPLSNKKFCHLSQLAKTIGHYDAYVCGSDQIWSPYMFDPVFYLDFVPQNKGIRKIAYAPSIGVTQREAITQKQCQMMETIDYVSCREQEGANLLSEILNHKVPVVLDPTLMLSRAEWEQIQSNIELPYNGKYILTYFLHTRYYRNNIPNHYIHQLKAQTGLNVVNIQMHNMEQILKADLHLYDCAPPDFIRLIANASYVVTNSFHCCVFSHLFAKRFFVFERYRLIGDTQENQNPRIRSFLNLIGVGEALITDENARIVLGTQQEDTNKERIEDARKLSFEFISKALS